MFSARGAGASENVLHDDVEPTGSSQLTEIAVLAGGLLRLVDGAGGEALGQAVDRLLQGLAPGRLLLLGRAQLAVVEVTVR